MNTIVAWQQTFSADLESMIERLGWVLVHSLWQFFIVALITFFVLQVMQRSSATTRYGFLVGVMGFMVTIPIATWMVLSSQIRIDLPDQPPLVSQLETNPQSNIKLNFPVVMRDSGIAIDHINPLPGSDVTVSKLGIEQTLPVSNQDATALTELTWMARIQSVVQPWLNWIVLSWVVGVILCSLRPILGWRMLRRLRREGVSSVSEEVQATVCRLSKQLGLRHVVHVMQSTLIKVPIVAGYLSPVILLPVSLLTSMPPAQLEAILAHELAHIRRHDFVINLFQTMIETLFFYHPAVWWLSNRIRVEREHCCDDMVVTCVGNNVEYGRALLAIAEHNVRYSVLALGAADGSLLSRVRRIVGVRSDGTPRRWIDHWPAVLSVFTLIGVALFLLIWNGMKLGNDFPEPVTEVGAEHSEPDQNQKVQDEPEGEVKKSNEARLREKYTQPITVKGQAFDDGGKPIPDAKIYIASVRADYKRLAETMTDAEGRYEFLDVPLPIEPAQRNSSDTDAGAFEVFGSATGKAFAWVPMKRCYIKRNANQLIDSDHPELSNNFYQFLEGNQFIVDLIFTEPTTIKGQIVDEQGFPIPDVKLAIRTCEELQSDELIKQGVINSRRELSALNQSDTVPADIKVRATDADGRFVFDNLPSECQFNIVARHTNYAKQSVYAATTNRVLPKLNEKWTIHTNDIELTCIKACEIPFRIVLDDTAKPAKKVSVSAANSEYNDGDETDENGLVTLKLPPGTYSMQLLPARGTRYVLTELQDNLCVPAQPPAEPITMRLKAGCELDVMIQDAETGLPVADVDLWVSDVNDRRGELRREVWFRSWDKPISWVDRPKSDQEGKLRAIIDPGEYRFGAIYQFRPEGYRLDGVGQVINCQAGTTVQVTFKLKRMRTPRNDGEQASKWTSNPNSPSAVSKDEQQKTMESRLDTAFNEVVDGIPASEVLDDIVEQLGAKLNIDHVEIWADGGSDDILSTNVTLTGIYDAMKNSEGRGYRSDWALSMLARGDGTISCRETLSAIIEPLGLDFHVIGDTLQISSREQIELMRKTKSIAKKNFDSEDDQGLRTRVVSAWPHRLGKPMALKVELRNFANVVRQFYPRSIKPYESIKCVGPDGKPLRFRSQEFQQSGEVTSIKPGETITLFETDDFSKFFDLTQVGQYRIQFAGEDDALGRRLRGESDVCSLPASLPLFFDLVDASPEGRLEYVNLKAGARAFNLSPDKRNLAVDFRKVPLDVALERICKEAFLNLELDGDGLTTVGVMQNVPVTFSTQDTLEEVLTLALKPFEGLSFTIDKNRVFVSSRERVAARGKKSSVATRIGTVISTDNMPVAGIEVLVFVGGNQLDQKFVTDERGQFRIPQAWGESSQFRKLVVRDGNQRLGWYDFYFHRQTGAGEPSNEDPFQIVLLPINQTIRGRVLDDQGKPLAGVELPVEYLDNKSNHASVTWRYFKPIDNPQFLCGVTNDDGEFEIHVPVDSMAMFSTRHPEWMLQHISVIQNLRDKIPDIKLAPAAIVGGQVIDSQTGTPLAGARITALADEPNLAIGGFGDAITDADGKYLIGGLNRGRFHIFFAEATERKLTAVAQEVNLEIGKPAEVNLSAIVGKRLSGRVVDAKSGQPISGRTVTYTGPARLGGNNSTADTDANGAFEFFVPPGRSKVAAAERGLVGLDSFREFDVPAKGELEPVVLKVGTPAFDGPPEKRIVTLDFQKTPLNDALEKLCKSAVVTLELDVEGLKTQGITKNVLLSVGTQELPLQEALTLLLKPFERLSFTIDKNRVFVSSRERVAARKKEQVTATAQSAEGNLDQPNSKEGDAEQSSKDFETDNILGRIVSLDAKGISLREAFVQLAREAKVPLELDEPELTSAKFDLNAPVTIKIVDEQLWTAITQLIELNDEIDLQSIIASRPGSRKLFLTTLNGYTKHNISNRPDWMKLSNATGLHPTIDDDGQVVSVMATSLTDELLQRLTTLPKLREMDISGETKLTADGLVHFADFAVLEQLSISGSTNLEAGVADEIVKQIVRVKSLRTLRLSETGVTDVGIRMLIDSRLTSLSLYQEGRITDDSLSVIVTMNRLKHLSLTSYVGTEKLGWMRFSPAAMNQLSSMKNLESLTIPGLPASVDLSGFSRLVALDMGGEFIDDAAAERISELRGLRNLTLADVRITEAGWKKIETLTGLRRISICRSRVSDEVLSEFQGMTKLNHLELRAYGFSDIGLGHLAKVRSLNRLDLWGSNFTLQGLQQLRDLPNLRTLCLSGFRDQGSYLGLKDLKQLRELSFMMSSINQAEFTELEKGLPKTRITSMNGGGSLRSIRNPNGF